jgi:F0F1-type ATP synthase membrane subunit c/vacuolar-type H+-ATPase subunit K
VTPDALDDQTLDLLNSELAGRLARQNESGSKIETKAVFVAGFVATASQFLATRHPRPLLGGFAYGAYAVAFLFGVLTVAIAKYKDIEPRKLVDKYARRSRAEVLAYLVSARVMAFEINRTKHGRKATCWWISVAALALGLALSIAAIVQTGSHDGSAGHGPSPHPSASHPVGPVPSRTGP